MASDPTWDRAVRKAFGDRIKAIRCHTSLSQEELAHRCGLDRSYIGQVERGESNLSLVNIYRIAEGLGVPASTLVGELNATLDFDPQEGSK